MSTLTEEEIGRALRSLPQWRLERGVLAFDAVFPDFARAMRFVTRVAALAEAMDHHPDIDIRYNKVHLELISHDVNGISPRDIRLAGRIEQLEPDAGA